MAQVLVRIESIFDVGLAKLLLQNGDYGFVSSKEKFGELLNVEALNQPHDVNISDLDQRAGVLVKGVTQAVNDIENIFRKSLPDAIIFSHKVQQDSVYLATVIKNIYRKRMAILDLDGKNTGIIFNVNWRVGDRHVVQVKELPTEVNKLPICSTVISLLGNYCILELNSSFVRVSKKIQGEERRRLHTMGKKLLPENFGIIVRTSAFDINESDLEFEITQMIEVWKRIELEIIENNNPRRLATGERVSEILIGYESKRYLDQLRGELESIVKNYHHFKSYSMATGFTLDFIQPYLDRIKSEEVENRLISMIMERDFRINNHVKAEFFYLDGIHEETVLGDIVKNGEYIRTSKILTHSLDELHAFDVESGDRMDVVFKAGSWTIHYLFYSGISGNKIGERVRITTPLNYIFRGRIRVFDMGMSLYYANDESAEVIHDVVENTRLNLVNEGVISEQLDIKLADVLRTAIKSLEEKEPIILISSE